MFCTVAKALLIKAPLYSICLSLLLVFQAQASDNNTVNPFQNIESPLLMLGSLAVAAPNANPKVIELALSSLHCASVQGIELSKRLAVIDYSLPSTQPRLWIFDLTTGKLLFEELVAHGKNSGENFTNSFSNTLGSLQSSLGLFRTKETYAGSNGYSLRMDGLEEGFNDKAMERAIVMHGAAYVNPKLINTQGRIGRSWGCPAVRAGIARKVIDAIKGEQFVFSYYPDKHWLAASKFLNCPSRQTLALSSSALNSRN